MSVEKNMNTRIQHKHDTEANWNKALNFIPKAGEIIIYDIDEHYNYSRFKIGDGVRTINNLEFSQTDTSAIIDVTQLPTEDIQEDCFYRLLTRSLVINQTVQNAYTIHCVDVLPETGEPATNMDNTAGNVYYDISAGDVYGYIDDILSAGLSIPVGWYDATTLLGAMGLSYAGIITDIEDDPRDGQFRLLLQYVNYSHKDGIWTSMKTIGWAGTGSRAEIFNHLSNVASGHYSHAEGYSSHAEGDCSHAEGNSSHAEGDSSHAEGSSSHAKGYFSHAEGNSSYAEGRGSHAEGYFSHAEGHYSHAEGCGSHAVGYSQHVQGEYNLVDPEYSPGISEFRAKYAHIVGNGTSEGTRSNAHTLDWDGNAWFAGDVYVGGTGQDDENAERLAKMSDIPSIEGFATESYVDSAVASLVNAAPDTLDTLNELAAALGDDANFATTVTNQISGKLDVSELPTAVNDALAQAKASGEFDGADGTNGKDGTSVTHSWSGTTLTITSASGTSSVDLKGEKGDAGKDGYSPVRGTDYWTEADQEAIVQQVIAALGTPVFGRVDADNNIILTGELADGTYTIKYEDAEGNVVEVGTLEHGEDKPNYTNQISISTDKDGSIFNGTGYMKSKRLNSSGELSDLSKPNATNPAFVTGFIPLQTGDVVRMKNCYMNTMNGDTSDTFGHASYSMKISYYDADKTYKNGNIWTGFAGDTTFFTDIVLSNDSCTGFTVNEKFNKSGYKFIRFTLAGTAEDAIITINEEIPETESSYTNQIPISTDTDGTIFNGVGYKEKTRGNSSGNAVDIATQTASNPVFFTGFIPCKLGDVIRLKNCYMYATGDGSALIYGEDPWGLRSGLYNSSKTKIAVESWGNLNGNSDVNLQDKFSNYTRVPASASPYIDDDGSANNEGMITQFTIAYAGTAFVRLCLAPDKANGFTPADAIVTVNEEIID